MIHIDTFKTSQQRTYSRHWATLILLLSGVLTGGIVNVSAQPENGYDEAMQQLRAALEQPFLEHGGFSAFDCSLRYGEKPKHPFTCTATAMDSMHLEYLLVPDPDTGLSIGMVTEPAAQLDYEWLPALDKTCRQFLKYFNQSDWAAIHAGFHPNLQKLVSLAELESTLVGVQAVLGFLEDPVMESYSSWKGGQRDELQYKVPATNGLASFRCGFNGGDKDATILAFLIAPSPESQLYRTSLEDAAPALLSAELGQKVVGVEIPFNLLPDVYDSAEGVAILENGERLKIRVSRSGRLDDFSPKDFTFQILGEQK